MVFWTRSKYVISISGVIVVVLSSVRYSSVSNCCNWSCQLCSILQYHTAVFLCTDDIVCQYLHVCVQNVRYSWIGYLLSMSSFLFSLFCCVVLFWWKWCVFCYGAVFVSLLVKFQSERREYILNSTALRSIKVTNWEQAKTSVYLKWILLLYYVMVSRIYDQHWSWTQIIYVCGCRNSMVVIASLWYI